VRPNNREPGFDLLRQQWCLLNRFRAEQEHCSACRRKWRFTNTDLCPCSESQAMSQIVESCPLTKLNGGLSRLRSADEDAVSWLTNYGSCQAYEKKKRLDGIDFLSCCCTGTSSESDGQNILLPNSSAFTGCMSQSTSLSNWLS